LSDGRTKQGRFHGRVEGQDRACAVPGCAEAGEFRAPGSRSSNFNGPGDWQWLCLDHVRAFNSGYNYFQGMSPEEIEAAQTPYGGWDRETRAFASAGTTPPPKWADFADPVPPRIKHHFFQHFNPLQHFGADLFKQNAGVEIRKTPMGQRVTIDRITGVGCFGTVVVAPDVIDEGVGQRAGGIRRHGFHFVRGSGGPLDQR